MKAEHPSSETERFFIRPSKIYDNRSRRLEEQEIERKLREEVDKQRNICLRLLRKGNIDIDGTDGAKDEGRRTEQLSPAEEQGMEEEEQREERRRFTS